MQTEGARAARRRRQRLDRASQQVRWPWLLAGISLLLGGFFQDAVAYGWLAAAAAGLLVVRLGLPVGEVQPAPLSGGRLTMAVPSVLTLGAHLFALWAITRAVADAVVITRGAVSMGNEALWMATAWGLYGLMLVLTAPLVSPKLPWLAMGQAVLTGALAFLLMGGLMAQARWADPLPRFAAYAGVPGAAALGAWVQRRRGRLTEPDRLLALAAAALGFGIVSFEVLRWLDPVFTYPGGVPVTPAMLARDRNLQSLSTVGLWIAYSVLLWGIGQRLRSRSVPFLATVLLGSALIYGIFWAAFASL